MDYRIDPEAVSTEKPVAGGRGFAARHYSLERRGGSAV
jgi:hypothetical protein